MQKRGRKEKKRKKTFRILVKIVQDNKRTHAGKFSAIHETL